MLWCQGVKNSGLSNHKLKFVLLVAMHNCPRQTDERHDNSAIIHSNECISVIYANERSAYALKEHGTLYLCCTCRHVLASVEGGRSPTVEAVVFAVRFFVHLSVGLFKASQVSSWRENVTVPRRLGGRRLRGRSWSEWTPCLQRTRYRFRCVSHVCELSRWYHISFYLQKI